MKATNTQQNIVSGEIKFIQKRFNLLHKSKPRNMSNMAISIVAHLEFVSLPPKKFSVFVLRVALPAESLFYINIILIPKPTYLPMPPTTEERCSGFLYLFFLHFLSWRWSLKSGTFIQITHSAYKANIHQSPEAAVHLFLSLAHLSAFILAV